MIGTQAAPSPSEVSKDSPKTMPVNDVRFVKELYPRAVEDDAAIERYRASLDLLPPIVVANKGILVDGYHRWKAYERENREFVPFVSLGDITEIEIFNESIERNATHGQQLAAADKARLAAKLWQTNADLPKSERLEKIARLLSASERAVQSWTQDARKDERHERQRLAWDMWLDCYTHDEIAVALSNADDQDRTAVSKWIVNFRNSAENHKSPEPLEKVFSKCHPFDRAPESLQVYDIWSFGKADDNAGQKSHFGRMPAQIVENLLWRYTKPWDVVFDPFAGGGTTIDVAKRMWRRVWSSDRKPKSELLPIREHDITAGWPDAAPPVVDFVLLDPPYWIQAAGRYSEDPEDMGNMSYDDFVAAWSLTVAACAAHLRPGHHLAFIVSPAKVGDVVYDLMEPMLGACYAAGLVKERRRIVPYSTQQYNGTDVNRAKDSGIDLCLFRDLVVMRK